MFGQRQGPFADWLNNLTTRKVHHDKSYSLEMKRKGHGNRKNERRMEEWRGKKPFLESRRASRISLSAV
ncbi:hypothetical protein R3I94_016515 [Phoxinus phoxinus]